jgi:hypothetical protein
MKLNEEVVTNDKWETEDQELFWKIIKRKRNKIEPARIKGRFLTKTNITEKIKNALDILSHFTDEFFAAPDKVLEKEKFPSLYRGDLIDICRDKLKYALLLNDITLAEKYCDEGAEIHFYESKNEKVKAELERNKSHLFSKCIVYCDMADYYLLVNKLKEAKKWLDLHIEKGPKFELYFHNDGYATHLKHAYLSNDFSYCKLIRQSCKENFDYYLSHGNKDYIDIVTKEINNDLAKIAEGFYMGFHAHPLCKTLHIRSKKALQELDVAFQDIAEYSGEQYNLASFPYDFKHDYLLPELGAYLGEVLCNEYKGEWVIGNKVMDSAITIGKVSINPFSYAYDVIFYGYRLSKEIIDDIEGKITLVK